MISREYDDESVMYESKHLANLICILLSVYYVLCKTVSDELRLG